MSYDYTVHVWLEPKTHLNFKQTSQLQVFMVAAETVSR